jgi:hypothetical protein
MTLVTCSLGDRATSAASNQALELLTANAISRLPGSLGRHA